MSALSAVVLNTHGTGALLLAILLYGLAGLLVGVLVYALLAAAKVPSARLIGLAVGVLVFLILLLG